MYISALLAVGALSATASAATCVSATTTSSMDLVNYTAAAAPVSGTSYDVDAGFAATYAFNSTMVYSAFSLSPTIHLLYFPSRPVSRELS